MAESDSAQQITPQQPPSSDNTLSIKNFAWLSKKKTVSFFSIYFLGIFLCLFANPSPLSADVLDDYSEKLQRAERVDGLFEAEERVHEARMELDAVNVWFWNMRAPYNELVPQKRELLRNAERELRTLEKQRDAQLREARQVVGLWSSFGVEGARDIFWGAVESGKLFAKKQTFWNGFWMMLDNREGSIVSYLLEWALAMVSNYTLGLLGALIAFVFRMPGLIYSFAPDVFSGTLFFMLALVAAVSMVLTYIMGIWGATAGAVYCMAQVAKNNPQLLEGGRRRRQRQQFIRHQGYRQAPGNYHYE